MHQIGMQSYRVLRDKQVQILSTMQAYRHMLEYSDPAILPGVHETNPSGSGSAEGWGESLIALGSSAW